MPEKTEIKNEKKPQAELSVTTASWYRQGVMAFCLMTVIPVLSLGFFLVTYLLPNVVPRESLLLVLILCLLLSSGGFIILHNVLSSFYKFRACIETVASGNLDQEPLTPKSSDDADIASSMKTIIERLQQDRCRLEDLLKESQESFRDIIKRNADGILIVDLETKGCKRANPALCQMFGYTVEELATLSLFDLHPQKTNAHVADEFEAQVRGEKTLATNLPCLRKDGILFYADVNASKAFIDDKPYWVGFFRDVTERKRTEEEIHQLNEELERHIRDCNVELQAANQELAAFSYSVSHNLRAPLQAVGGCCNLLKENYADGFDLEGRRVLDIISIEIQRIGRLIDGLRAFSDIGRQLLKMELIEPRALVDRARQELSSGGADTRIIEWKIGDLPASRGDSGLLFQVWVNLLSNAVKFTGNKDPAVIEIGSRPENGQIVYYVKDNGAGFDMRHASKLFGVFQRLHTEKAFEGVGMGLALVRRIVRRLGGRVWAEGKIDEGATFYFSLPANDTEGNP